MPRVAKHYIIFSLFPGNYLQQLSKINWNISFTKYVHCNLVHKWNMSLSSSWTKENSCKNHITISAGCGFFYPISHVPEKIEEEISSWYTDNCIQHTNNIIYSYNLTLCINMSIWSLYMNIGTFWCYIRNWAI